MFANQQLRQQHRQQTANQGCSLDRISVEAKVEASLLDLQKPSFHFHSLSFISPSLAEDNLRR